MIRLLLAASVAAIIGALIALGLPLVLLCVVGAIMICFALVAVACQPAEETYPDDGDQL